MPILLGPESEVNSGGPTVRHLALAAISPRSHARSAVAAFRARRDPLVAAARPIEAARLALLSHLHALASAGRLLDDTEAGRVAVAVIIAYLGDTRPQEATPMHLTLSAVQARLVDEISDPSTSRDSVCDLYRRARRGGESWDWAAIDAAVVARFGPEGLAAAQRPAPPVSEGVSRG